MGLWEWTKNAAVEVGNGIANTAAGVVAVAEEVVIAVPNAGKFAYNVFAEDDVEYFENPNVLGWDRVDSAHEVIDSVDAAVSNTVSGVAEWTTETAYPWVTDTALPAVGNGIAYAGAGVVAGVENTVSLVPNAGILVYNQFADEENQAAYVDNVNILGWDRVDDAHEFYDYVADNPGRSSALALQGGVNALTSVGGSIVGLGTDAVRGVWNTGEIIVVDGLINGVVINGSKGFINLGLDDDEDIAYTELQGADRYDGVFKATVGIPRFLNDWTQIQDAMPDNSAAYYAFARPEMEIVVDASTVEFSADPDGEYIQDDEGNYILAPEDENGERNGEYSVSSFDIIRPHENPEKIFIGADGEVVEGIHSDRDNPAMITVDVNGDAIDTIAQPREIVVGPDGERIEGPNVQHFEGEDGESIPNPDYIVPTIVPNPVYEGSREVENPDYVAGELVDNPDYKEIRNIQNPHYGYERGITYGAQAAVEIPIFVAMTIGTGGTVGAALASGRTITAKGASLIDDGINALRTLGATPIDEGVRGAELVIAGSDETVRVATEASTATVNTTGNTVNAGQQAIDDAIAAAEGVARQPAAGVATGTNTANVTAASSSTGTTTALESVRGANLARDAVEISEQTWKPWRPFSTQASREARVDGIINGQRAGAAGENLPGMRALTGARTVTEADFLQHIARNVTRTPDSFLGRLWVQTGGRLPIISRPAHALHRAESRLDGLVARGASPERIATAEQAVMRATEKVEAAVERAVTQWNQIAARNPNIAAVTTEEALQATQRVRALSSGQQIIDSAAVGAHSTGRFMSPGRGIAFEVAGAGGAFAMGYYGDKANAEAVMGAGQDIAGQSAVHALDQASQTDLEALARAADAIIAEESTDPPSSAAEAFNTGSSTVAPDTSETAGAFNDGARNTPRPGAAQTLQLDMGGVVINVENFDENAKAGAVLGAQKY